MPTLQTTVNGLKLPNPFVIASGPPGTNANVIGKAFDEGWGAVICKTVSLDAAKVINVQPRYARLRSRETGEIYGWENIELISDRPFDTWITEFREIKDRYPDGVLIASIMEECRRDAWHEIVERCQDAGVDALELNMSGRRATSITQPQTSSNTSGFSPIAAPIFRSGRPWGHDMFSSNASTPAA